MKVLEQPHVKYPVFTVVMQGSKETSSMNSHYIRLFSITLGELSALIMCGTSSGVESYYKEGDKTYFTMGNGSVHTFDHARARAFGGKNAHDNKNEEPQKGFIDGVH